MKFKKAIAIMTVVLTLAASAPAAFAATEPEISSSQTVSLEDRNSEENILIETDLETGEEKEVVVEPGQDPDYYSPISTVIDSYVPRTSIQDKIADNITEDQLQKACEDYALKWINSVTNDPSYQISDVTPMYIKDDLAGYDIGLERDNVSSGYVVIDFTNSESNYISEYTIDGLDLKDLLISNVNTNKSSIFSAEEKLFVNKIYFVAPFEYVAEVENKGKSVLINMDQKIISVSELKEMQENLIAGIPQIFELQNRYDTIIDAAKRVGSVTQEGWISGSKGFKFVGSKTDDYGTRTYGCTPTAVTNMMYYFAKVNGHTKLLINNRWFSTYDEIYKVLHTNNGNTQPMTLTAGYVSQYIRNKGYKSEWVKIVVSSFDNIKNNIAVNRPVIYDYYYTAQNGSISHSVFIVGYSIHSNGNKYFACIDGWNAYARYINLPQMGSFVADSAAFTCY